MRIEANVDVCIGAGQCVFTSDELFDQRDEDGTVVVLQPTPPAGLEQAARDAVGLCPSGALRIVED